MVSEKLSKVLKYVHYQAFYFIFYGGYIPFLLYFPIYLKHIGLNAAQVGVISGIRPIFQSIVTPLLVVLGDRLKARKLLFITSSLVAVVKLLLLFLLLKPSKQLCIVKTVDYVNRSVTVEKHSYFIEHKLSKRSVVTQDLLRHGKNQYSETIASTNINARETQPPFLSKVISAYQREMDEGNRSAIQSGNAFAKNNIEPISMKKKNMTDLIHDLTKPMQKAVKNRTRTEHEIVNDEEEVRVMFYSLLVVVLIFDVFDAAMFTLVDHSCMDHQKESYGDVRLWGTLGWGFMAPLIAIVLHNVPHELCGRVVDTYHYIFIFALVFFNISLLVGSHIDLSADFTSVKSRKIHGTLSNFHYGMFLIVFAYAGFCNGFLFTFVNWFIDEIGGSASVMGVATGCKCVIDVVLFFLLKKVIDRFGHVPLLSVGLVGHIAVFYVFSRIANPWFVVLAEIFHALCYGFLVSTSAHFLDQFVPAGSNIRLQALLHGIYWGVGSGSGALFSGLHVQNSGFHETFIIFTWVTTAFAFVLLAVELLTLVMDLQIFGDQDSGKSPYTKTSTGSEADVSSAEVETDDESQ